MNARAQPGAAWIEQALALAMLGEGTTSPNPLVGCVIVSETGVVGTGYHRAAGEPHAEAMALEQAGEAARGATMYVNLEPCSHHGRTPPCVDRIAECGIRRVVASILDPDPRVDGAGFRRLEQLGVHVEIGAGARHARRLNRLFLHWHERSRPWVTLKAATTLDGQLAARNGSSRWITGEPARRFAHRLRARHDAVLVGGETLRRDDPRLDVRLAGVSRTPCRVVLTRRFELDPRARIFRRQGPDDPPTRVYSGRPAPAGFAGVAGDVIARRVPGDPQELDLGWVLADLAAAGVRSVLVEGGGRTIGAFLRQQLVDEVALFTASSLIGARQGTPLADMIAVEHPDRVLRLTEVRRLGLGDDQLILARVAFEGREPTCSPD